MTNSDIIEARVIACLANHLSCRVAAEVPEDFPADAALVVVSRLGERRENHLRRASPAAGWKPLIILRTKRRSGTAISRSST